jgi:hypothetical protein
MRLQGLAYQDTGVEEDKHYDEPEHGLRLDRPPARPPGPTVELVEGFLLLLPERVRLDDDALVADLVSTLENVFYPSPAPPTKRLQCLSTQLSRSIWVPWPSFQL